MQKQASVLHSAQKNISQDGHTAAYQESPNWAQKVAILRKNSAVKFFLLLDA